MLAASPNPNETQDIIPSVKTAPSTSNVRFRKAPAVHDAIIAKRALGQSISQIARDLGIARNTVRLHLSESKTEQWTTRAEEIIPLAIKAVHDAVKKGDSSVALRYLDLTGALSRPKTISTGDTNLAIAINTLVRTEPVEKAEKATSPSSTVIIESTESTGSTEAPKKEGVG